jgi:putative SOS response-associated peptidase YedK
VFRFAFRRTRWLIPTSGIMNGVPRRAASSPTTLRARAGRPLTIAWLWYEWRNVKAGQQLLSCTMITRASKSVSDYPYQMPMLLSLAQHERWTDDYLRVWPVSRRVNTSRAPDDDQSLIERITA